jgi:predicted membrane protein, putative toxin regulator
VGSKAAVTPMDWIGLVLISFILPGVLSWLFSVLFRKIGWIKEGDMRLDL